MDKLVKNKVALREYLQEWIDYHPDDQTGIPLTMVEDKENGHFFLLEVGMGQEGWVHTLFIHLLVNSDGTIMLLANNTDQEPFAELMEKGVDRKDLIIAWEPPELRSQLQQAA